MTYYYHICYKPSVDDFYAYVDDGSRTGMPIFHIHNIREICDYIVKNKMDHIDDVDGLEKLLKQSGLIKTEDIILLSEELIC